MSSMMELLAQQLGGGTTTNISRQLGADEQATGKAMAAALPLLLSALQRNATDDQGAESLHRALAKDHDGSILDNLGGFLQGADQGPGDGILRHALGSRRAVVERQLSASSGLDADSISRLLPMLAPIVMGALGKAQRSGNLDARGLAGMLGGENEAMQRAQPEAMGLLGRMLDADNDGDVDVSDIASKGLGFLGQLSRGR